MGEVLVVVGGFVYIIIAIIALIIKNEKTKKSNTQTVYTKNSDNELNDVYKNYYSTKLMNNNWFWTKVLRTISIISFMCSIVISLIILSNIDSSLGGVIAIVVMLLSMITTSGIMVFVEMSENIAKTRKDMAKNREHMEKLLEILSDKK